MPTASPSLCVTQTSMISFYREKLPCRQVTKQAKCRAAPQRGKSQYVGQYISSRSKLEKKTPGDESHRAKKKKGPIVQRAHSFNGIPKPKREGRKNRTGAALENPRSRRLFAQLLGRYRAG